MITAQEVLTMTFAIIDEVLDTGAISASDTKAYTAKAPMLFTMGQNELMTIGDLFSKLELSRKMIPNTLGYSNGFDMVEHIDTDIIKESNLKVTAYSFEVDGEATVYIEDYTSQWNVLATINVPSTITTFTNYNGIVTPTNSATRSRIRFSGAYYYKITNYAMFNYPLKLSQVPKYAPWVKITMPADFKSQDKIVTEYPDRQYSMDTNSKWEGVKDYYVNYFYEGKIRIVYKPVPIPITSMTQTLQIDDITATTVLPYLLAWHFMNQENDEMAKIFKNKYEQQKAINTIKGPSTITQIIDVYGGGWNG